MTREEAITVLKGLSDNPLFSYQHRAAFNIAIHDIKQRHDWNINNLILINKDNYEPQEPILDKIRAEIEKLQKMCDKNDLNLMAQYSAFGMVLDILDKYKAESEAENRNE